MSQTYTERRLNRTYRAWKQATRKERESTGHAKQQRAKAFQRLQSVHKQAQREVA